MAFFLRNREKYVARTKRIGTDRIGGAELLESRVMMAGDLAPVLMVVADQQDFYYQEYGDTRASIETAGLDVVVAATTTDNTVPHRNTGEGPDGGLITPDIALVDVEPERYTAIVFVGGWGSSMYQYDFPGDYSNDHYDGDASTKATVNELINGFLENGSPVAAICHGVTVLAWARVDGVSPLAGVQVSVPFIGSPAVYYSNTWYSNYELGQYEQVVANGGIANTSSGQYGDPTTAEDDVVVDGNIVTAENYDSASTFGTVLANEVLNNNTAREAVSFDDGVLSVNGSAEDDTIYIWSSGVAEQVYVWFNGETSGPFVIPDDGEVVVRGNSGNDEIYATSSAIGATIFGDEGHDQITGSSSHDVIDGGSGVDRIWGNAGDDLIRGGSDMDIIHGRDGNDILLGGDGNDYLYGFSGNDIIIGGLGNDRVQGDGGEDLLIGGTTDYDASDSALEELSSVWNSGGTIASRVDQLTNGVDPSILLQWNSTVHDDGVADVVCGGSHIDIVFQGLFDYFDGEESDLVIEP